ncbi:glycosyltransferase [Pseudofulvibacter geojedonensis]|uniref:Glycosyltransferase n=1 Tax=Pseudofulvibacter geojedonensis TaxID=1123758 RepID=A0ABW3I4Q0_9FLAO
MKVGIIIPCYNEEKRLNLRAFRLCLERFKSFNLCFVNDGSSDNTVEVLQSLKEDYKSRVSIIDKSLNEGKAAAIRDGANYLHQNTNIGYIGYLDADLSTDFEDFNELLESLKSDRKLIMVFGSRNCGTNNIERNPLRKLFSTIIMKFIQLILQLPIKDTQCGAKVFRSQYVPVMYNSTFKTRWLFDVEQFYRLKYHFSDKNLMDHIKEQPLNKWNHVDDSKLTIKDSVQIPFKIIQVWYTYSF